MGSSQADKRLSHERIVKLASRRIRRDGVDGLTVGDLMQEAGLTHGGFYRHVESRDALVDESVEAALADGSKVAEAVALAGDHTALIALIDGYLSTLHRDHPDSGCAVTALPSDVARSSDRARAAYAKQVERYIELLISLGCEDDQARMVLAALVGAIAMARAIPDPEESAALLAATARALHRYVDSE
jgi:TetR/AcrR family transcriptional repressor of nem operon